MTYIPSSLTNVNNVPTFDQFYGRDLVQLANLVAYDESGNPAHLPSASEIKEVADKMYTAQFMRMVMDKLATFGTSQAIGTITSYLYAYADLASPYVTLPYATKSVSPYPASQDQVILYKNQGILVRGVDWTFGPTGITLTTALVTGDTVEMIILSPDLARGVFVHAFNGSVGTGTGNRTWLLNALGEDLEGSSITVFPTTSGRCWVHRNGLKQANTLDYTFSGTGVTAQVAFDSSLTIADDETIMFIILGV